MDANLIITSTGGKYAWEIQGAEGSGWSIRCELPYGSQRDSEDAAYDVAEQFGIELQDAEPGAAPTMAGEGG